MSIKVVTLVWDNFPGSGSELLAMLALADWGNDEGGSIHPSILTLARKIRTSESQARRVLRKLEADGFLRVVGNHEGGAPGSTRRYEINVGLLRQITIEGITGSADATPRTDATPRMDARDGSHGCARRVAPMQAEPLLTTKEPLRVDTRASALPDWLPQAEWQAFLIMRKGIKKPLTDHGITLAIKKLDDLRLAGHPPADVLNQSTLNCWQGLFEIRGQGQVAGNRAMTVSEQRAATMRDINTPLDELIRRRSQEMSNVVAGQLD